jgi:lipopolysaccharide transport system permease protein
MTQYPPIAVAMLPPCCTNSTRIESTSPSWNTQLGELWQYRELLYFLIWRDIKVRYNQTVMGIAWAIVQPLFIALTLSLFLGRLAKVPTNGPPYFLFAYSAMAVWQLFAQALTGASNSLIVNEELVTLVYFPRLLVPLSAVLACMLDFLVALILLVPFLAWYRVKPSSTILALPLFVLLALLIAIGVGFWLAALNVKYRDVRHTVGFLVQLWFLATPVAYSIDVVPQAWRMWYGLNPMVSVVEGFRWSLLATGPASIRLLVVSLFATSTFLFGGIYYFLSAQDTFADFI